MATLTEEFEAYKAQGTAEQEYHEYLARKAHEEDIAQGGSIRAAPSESRLPIGATVGGIVLPLVSAAASGGTSLLASAAISALGGTGGEAIQQLLERALQVPGYELTTGESIKHMLREGLLQAGAGVAGTVGFNALKRVVAPYGHAITPEGASAADVLRPHLQPPLLPAQQTSARGLALAQNVAEKSAFGGGIVRGFKQKQADIIDKVTRDFVDTLGPSVEESKLGQLIEEATASNFKMAKSPAKFIYQQVQILADPVKRTVTKTFEEPTGLMDQLGNPVSRQVQRQVVEEVGGAKINMVPLKEGMKDLQDQLTRLNLPAEGRTLQGGSLLDTVMAQGDTIRYSDAQRLRSTLSAISRKLSVENAKAPAIRLANTAVKQVDDAIESGLREFNPDLGDLWKFAKGSYSDANKQFNNELIRKVIRRGLEEAGSGPENTVRAVLQPGQPTRLAAIKEALGPESDEWAAIKYAAGKDLLLRATGPKSKVIEGSTLQTLIDGRPGGGNYGAEMMNVLYSPAETARWRGLANAFRVAQARQAEGTGGMLIQLVQGGALVGIGTLRYFKDIDDPQALAGAGLILLGPAAIATLMRSELGAKWLLRAAYTPKYAPDAAATVGRLMVALGRTVPDRLPPYQASPAGQIQPGPLQP